MVVQYHADNDGSGHTTDTKFSPELSANEVHGEVELCVLMSSPRTLVERRSAQTEAVASAIQTHHTGQRRTTEVQLRYDQ